MGRCSVAGEPINWTKTAHHINQYTSALFPYMQTSLYVYRLSSGPVECLSLWWPISYRLKANDQNWLMLVLLSIIEGNHNNDTDNYKNYNTGGLCYIPMFGCPAVCFMRWTSAHASLPVTILSTNFWTSRLACCYTYRPTSTYIMHSVVSGSKQ